MRIQANLYFTQTAVKCVPIDPDHSSYAEELALDDGALEFRLRLFAARVRGEATAVHVALGVPADCVLNAQDGPTPFGDIPRDELHIVPLGDDAHGPTVAVERRVCDEVAAFARTYGMAPIAIILPCTVAGVEVTFPIVDGTDTPIPAAQSGASARGAPSSIEIPPALQRELDKRNKTAARKTERAGKGWGLGSAIPAAQGSDHPPLPQLPPLGPTPSFLRPVSAAPDGSMPDRQVANPQPAVAAAASAPRPPAPAQVAANVAARPAWHKRPALLMGTAACLALLVGGAGIYLRSAPPMSEMAEAVSPPVLPAATAIATAPPAHLSARASAPITQPDSAVEPPADANADAGSDQLISSASLGHAAPMRLPRPVPPQIDDRGPARIALPRLGDDDAMGATGINGQTDMTPSRQSVIFPSEPEIAQIMPPRVPGRGVVTGRSIASLQATYTPSPTQALRPVTLLRPAASLARIAPQPRPERPVAPALYTPPPIAPALAPPASLQPGGPIDAVRPVSLLGPAIAPRPVARPTALVAGLEAEGPSLAATGAPPTAPELQPEILPQGPVPGLRVLAIVGSGDQRQALVQTGPNQTAVLVAGAATRRWQVLEVRREGIVLRVNGRAQLLPIGL